MPEYLPSGINEKHDYVEYRNVRIPMSDGTELYANLFFPAKNGVVDFEKKYPVIMNRTAYMDVKDTMFPNQIGYYLCEHGYVALCSGVRGTHLSGGTMHPIKDETWKQNPEDHQDGLDTIEWIRKQPWSNGQVATCGMSYLGATQLGLWFAGDIEGLETSVINSPAMNNFGGGWVYAQDFADASSIVAWTIGNALRPGYFNRLPKDIKEKIEEDCLKIGDIRNNPMLLADVNFYAKLQQEYSYREMPVARWIDFYQEWLDHRDDPEYFRYSDTLSRKHDMKKPIVYVTGWFDPFKMNCIKDYELSVKDAPDEEVRNGHHLIIGPWNHDFNPFVPLRRFPEGETDQRLFHMEWFEQQLRGVKSDFFQNNKIALFVMGENRWRSEETWPLKDEVRTKMYLHSDGAANTRLGSGSLTEAFPSAEESADHYVFDPANPVVSYGGQNVFAGGMADQRSVELRNDVLVYTSPVLAEDVEVTGNVTGSLFASTSAEDTDFFMKLLDVGTDGTVYNIVTGGRRGRYVKNGRTNPTPLTPGEVLEYKIDLKATSYVFKKGHQIRVEVSSSDSLLSDVNPNAFVDLNACTKKDYVIADQTIYHNAEHSSYIELPIIPADRSRNWIDWPFAASVTGLDWSLNNYDPNPPVFAEYDGEKLPIK